MNAPYESRQADAWQEFKGSAKDPYGRDYSDYDGKETTLAHSAFNAGWRARTSAALGPDGHVEEEDKNILLQAIELHRDVARRENGWVLHFIGREMAAERRVRALQQQIRDEGNDPSEAPLWRRIAEQRRHIRELERLLKAVKDNPKVRYVVKEKNA